MNTVLVPQTASLLADADMQAAPVALARAARRAREIAAHTGTPLILRENGKIIEKIVAPTKSEQIGNSAANQDSP